MVRKTMAPLCGWLAGRAERVRLNYLFIDLLTSASWAGTAAAGAAAVRAAAVATGSPSAGVASPGEAAATTAAAKAATSAGKVVGRRAHRGDGVVALPGAGFELHKVLPLSCCVEG